jgi:hypothetical protein
MNKTTPINIECRKAIIATTSRAGPPTLIAKQIRRQARIDQNLSPTPAGQGKQLTNLHEPPPAPAQHQIAEIADKSRP